MNVKYEKVILSELEKTFDIIADVITKNINTQVFVDKKIIFEFKRNGSIHNIYSHNGFQSFHYFEGREEFFSLHTSNALSQKLYSASFVSNSSNYKQLVEFSGKGIDYTHFLTGFEQLLIVELEND